MTRKKRKTMMRTLAVLLIMVFMINTLTGCSCASRAETTDAELAETEATETDAAEETTTGTETITDEETTDAEELSEVEIEEETETETEEETEPEATTTVTEETTTEAETTTKEASTTTTKASGYTYTSMSKTMYVKQQVNVRSLPSTDGTKLGSLSTGTAVTVTGQCNETNWYRIEYNGSVGYVSNNYLTTTKPSETTTTTKNSSESSTTKASSGSGTTTTTTVSDATLKAYAAEVVELVNKERKAAGLWEYSTNDALTKAAMARAKELATSYSHTRPDGTDFYTILTEYGICWLDYAENIAMGQTTPEQVMSDWMASAGHKGNIMYDYISTTEYNGVTYKSYNNSIGVGCYYKDGVYYWVQIFAELHTHEWEDTTTLLVWSGNMDGVTCYMCTNPFCNAYKDLNGVVHEHYN